MASRRKKLQDQSNQIGSDVFRRPWPDEIKTLAASAKQAFSAKNTERLREIWTELSHAVCEEVVPNYEPPNLEVRHRKATKRTLAKYDWWRGENRARIQLDFEQEFRHGWHRHASDFAHELCHHVDVWAFGLADSYHTPAFYMRCTLLSLMILRG